MTRVSINHRPDIDDGADRPPPADDVGFDIPFEGLPRPLAEDLADLHGLPATTAEAILQMLPFGYRAALEGLACLRSDTAGAVTLTERGWQLIAEAHAHVRHDGNGPSLDVMRRELRELAARVGDR